MHGVEVEAHDEVVEWLSRLSGAEWDRAAVVIDRLAQVGQRARARKVAQDCAKNDP